MVLGSGIRDPGSGKNLFRIPDPGVKKAPDPGSGSATLLVPVPYDYTGPHCLMSLSILLLVPVSVATYRTTVTVPVLHTLVWSR
jgi:hypothetical protein